MCKFSDFTKCVFLVVCVANVTPSTGERVRSFQVALSGTTCGSNEQTLDRIECPDLVSLTREAVADTGRQFLDVIEAIERTRKRLEEVNGANDFHPVNITDFSDVYDPSSKLGRIVRRKASTPEKLLHTSYMSMAVIQAYMAVTEDMLEGPNAQDMGAINNKTRDARCNLMDFTKNLGIRKLKNKFFRYKSEKKYLRTKSDLTNYFISVMRHGVLSAERVLSDMEELKVAIKGCEYKSCGRKLRLDCSSKSKKRVRSMKGRKGRKGRKGGKGKKERRGRGCGKKSDNTRLRHEKKRCKSSRGNKKRRD